MFNTFRWGHYFDDYWYSLKSNIVEFTIHILIVYGHIFYLVPKLIYRKKYWTYVGLMILILGLVYVIRTEANLLLVTNVIFPESPFPSNWFDIDYILALIIGEIYVIAFVTAIKFVAEWFIEKKKNEQLAQLQLNTELKYLRTQIQPHFFFNTLNSLYALTLKKSDNAPRLVLKLSDMMQYILYEVEASKVSLFQEINHINNFLDIEHLRFPERIEAEMDITGNIDDIEVPPLLFLSFIENCFKHGLKADDKMIIRMSFEITNNKYLLFKLSNSFDPNKSKENRHGIGLQNSERRLQLLFGNNFDLNANVADDMYNLFLKIPIK
ncbi:MAG TPA: histidine kinase [Flavobacteriaceae bacterium]|nr:histidine kinase [Flavobacteriaceae bacterium]